MEKGKLSLYQCPHCGGVPVLDREDIAEHLRGDLGEYEEQLADNKRWVEEIKDAAAKENINLYD